MSSVDSVTLSNINAHRTSTVNGMPRCMWPELYYTTLKGLLNMAVTATGSSGVAYDATVVEVGFGFGYFYDYLVEQFGGVSSYAAIDPYPSTCDSWHFLEEVDALVEGGATRADKMDVMATFASEKMAQSAPSTSFARASAPAVFSGYYAPSNITLAFIDGSHASADVAADLESVWPQMRSGGIVAVDDYDDATHGAGVQAGIAAFLVAQGGAAPSLQFAGSPYRIAYFQKA